MNRTVRVYTYIMSQITKEHKQTMSHIYASGFLVTKKVKIKNCSHIEITKPAKHTVKF